MIAKKNYCEIILNSPDLLAEMIKNDAGTQKPDTIIRNLQRASPNMRRSMAFIKTLRDAGYTEEQIFEETEKAAAV